MLKTYFHYVFNIILLFFQEDSLQFFKEEKVDGAVYNLYLKKVRYHTPCDDVGRRRNLDGDDRRVDQVPTSVWYRNAPLVMYNAFIPSPIPFLIDVVPAVKCMFLG